MMPECGECSDLDIVTECVAGNRNCLNYDFVGAYDNG